MTFSYFLKRSKIFVTNNFKLSILQYTNTASGTQQNNFKYIDKDIFINDFTTKSHSLEKLLLMKKKLY